VPSDPRTDRVAAGRNALALAREVVDRIKSEQVTFLAAGIAYYAFVSMLPALLLLLAVASAVGGDDLATRAVESFGDALSPVGQDLLRETLLSASGRAPATLVGLPVLAWGTLKVFRGLAVAFGRIYRTESNPTFVEQVRDAATALGAVGLGLAVLVAVGLGLAVLVAVGTAIGVADVAYAGIVGTLVLGVVLTVVFLPLYYVFPSVAVSARSVLPGTALAAVGWTVLGTGFRLYAASADQFALYGFVGAVLLLVTWLYVGSIVLLAGATLNAVLADRADETGTPKSPPTDSPDIDRA